MDIIQYNGEPVADPGKLIRLTLRGHYVRWRLEQELASSSSSPYGPPARETGRRPRLHCG